MGKNSDIESISNSLSKTILHKILIEYTNRLEPAHHLVNEEIEYRGQSMKKIDKRKLNNEDKKKIINKVLKKIINRLKLKYSDININIDIIKRIVDEEINSFFD